ncbi:hypothetical protein EJ08DRAFT_679707 [Tothia fuscella]|uniref:BTB domain-containing protein n=1 Tax=Tothia fuscella TaxID=1048955 RepID=A0A9P4TYC5_9PEZI|nr:hypothetical protein EJ08DRAFT_679707 [Tothia fuscella]
MTSRIYEKTVKFPATKQIDPVRSLITGFGDLLISGEGSDAVLYHKESAQRWRVHKVIICSQSEYFQRALKEHWKSGKIGEVEFDHDPGVYSAVINFLYRFDYDVPESYAESILTFHAQVNEASGFYQIKELGSLAQLKFEIAVKERWNTEDFVNAMEIAYNETGPTDDGLRKPIINISTEHIVELLESDIGFQETWTEIEGFAEEIVNCQSNKLLIETKEKPCGGTTSLPGRMV